MVHLVTGGSGSGKSAYAEEQVLQLGEGRRIYLATMQVNDEESVLRVAKHREMRKEKTFETIERTDTLENLEIPDDSIVLLECVSNLLANEMFMPGKSGIHAVSAVIDGIEHIQRHARHLVIVTNEVFSSGVAYGGMTRVYLEFLGIINQHLGRTADMVTEVVFGIPIPVKRPGEGIIRQNRLFHEVAAK